MIWFEKIVNEAFQRTWTPKEKENVETIGFIPHDKTAFRPGDEVLYTLNTGHGIVDVYGTVVSNNNGESITIETKREKGRELTTRSMWNEKGGYNTHLKHCKSWIKPVIDSKCISFTAQVYEVSYETSKDLTVFSKEEEINVPDGIELIVVKDKYRGKKFYYKWPDGEKVGEVDCTKENLGNRILLPKINEPEPKSVDKNKYDKNSYVKVPSEAILVDSNGKFYAWNYKYIKGLFKYCPWLKEMAADWAWKIGGEKYHGIPKLKNT